MALRFMCENFAVKDGGNVGERVGKGYAKTYKEYAESKFYLVHYQSRGYCGGMFSLGSYER